MSQAPKVTVITPTYNRPAYLPGAIRSVLAQEFTDWELLVVNDGGTDVQDLVESFGDDRITYFNRTENTGKAACLNFALECARGQYIAYLDDDDEWYPNHLSVLAGALEKNPHVGAAYADLYDVACIKDSEGRRIPLQKRLRVSRDFTRMFTFIFNQAIHPALMHRKDLALRAGGYDESVTVMIDWNLTRKLSFYADMLHVTTLTGNHYELVKDSDRISDREREDDENFLHNLRRVRADLPPEPWAKVQRVSVVFPVERWDETTRRIVYYFTDSLHYPCRIVLVNLDRTHDEQACRNALGKLAELRNLQVVAARPGCTLEEAYRLGAEAVVADWVYCASRSLNCATGLRLITFVCYAEATGRQCLRWADDPPSETGYDIVLPRRVLLAGGRQDVRGHSGTVTTIPAAWMPEELQADLLLHWTRKCEEEGDYRSAERFLERAVAVERGAACTPALAHGFAQLALQLGRYERAENLCRQMVDCGYGADNWTRLGQIYQRRGDLHEASDAYHRGLAAIGLSEEDLKSDCFPIVTTTDCDAFTALVGLGECCLGVGRDTEAAHWLRMAARLRLNSVRPGLAFGRLFLKHGQLDKAEEALFLASRQSATRRETAAVAACRAEVLVARGQSEDAWYWVRCAVESAPDDPDYIQQAFHVGRGADRADELAELAERHLAHRPGSVEVLLGLAELYHESGRKAEAVELAEKVLLIDPANRMASALAPHSAREVTPRKRPA